MLHSTIESEQVMISQVDFDRLSEVLRSPQYRVANGSFAALKEGLEHGVVVAPDQIPRKIVTMRSRVRPAGLGFARIRDLHIGLPARGGHDTRRRSRFLPAWRRHARSARGTDAGCERPRWNVLIARPSNPLSTRSRGRPSPLTSADEATHLCFIIVLPRRLCIPDDRPAQCERCMGALSWPKP